MGDFFKLFFGLLIVVVILFAFAVFFEGYVSSEELTIEVIDVEKMSADNDETYFLIYTEDEILENRNHYFHSKEKVDRLQSKIMKGKKYRVEVVGFGFTRKLPFFLKHRNITKVIAEIKDYKKLKGRRR